MADLLNTKRNNLRIFFFGLLSLTLVLSSISFLSALTIIELNCGGSQINEYSNGYISASELTCGYVGSCENLTSYISQGNLNVTTLNCIDNAGNPRSYLNGQDLQEKLDENKANNYNITIFGFSIFEVSILGITIISFTIYFLIKRFNKRKNNK